MDTILRIYQTIDAAEVAVDEMRLDQAQALAAIATARALADIANALRDDENNSPVHILHNMSYQLAVIARNAGAIDDDDDDDEPSIAEATRIVAAANRYK